MSVLSSLYIGTSGMTADGSAISVVGDNISNVNTIGYKSNRAEFADVLGGSLGDQRLGDGVRLGGVDTSYTQGQVQQTGNALDCAIQGNGFFVLKGNYHGQNGQFFTRNGTFRLDQNGFVANSEGLKVQGYLIDGAGQQSTTLSDLQLAGMTSPAVATTTAKASLNLDASAPVPAAWDPTNPQGTSSYSTSMTVYDSLGTSHQVQVYFRNQGGGSWEWHAMVDGGELTGGTKGVPTEIANGTMTFTPSGALQSQTTAASSASFVGAQPNQAIAFNFGDDIASGGTGLAGTTQFTGASSVGSLDIDGHGAGHLTDVSVDADGTVVGQFDNGDKRAMARLALATFADNQGLVRGGDGLYTQGRSSGAPLVDAAATGGRGAIQGGALEGSNVDLGNELVTMIAYQRSFQSDARVVTSADEMLQEVANLKR
jgi:flagellar hook protein FlgE